VRDRARLLQGTLKARNTTSGERTMIEEAADVFNAAWARLRVLERSLRAIAGNGAPGRFNDAS
jgi:hypothetical protein